MKRMSRNRVAVPKMNLTSLMDVFTILVFFLLVNSATTEVLETPKQITLPASVVEEKPRETVVIFISENDVTVQGESVVKTSEILTAQTQNIDPIATRLGELSETVIGLTTQAVAQSQEVTILADRTVPFTVIKRVMSTCTSRGYAQISLAVLQKAPETVLSQN
ncbi:MAG: biopolymer transporter ExbD [Deltaproteobacteria bacterium]|nr:biopolymer transporter ExbD [Deltaproteobacteria bacterium]